MKELNQKKKRKKTGSGKAGPHLHTQPLQGAHVLLFLQIIITITLMM